MEISFIIPTYNTKVVLIKRCLESILNQESYNVKFEVIIVNDGSNDNDLLQYLESIKDLNNIQIVCKENGGVSSARNFGMNRAKGKYICFVDADDYLRNSFFSTIKKFLFKDKDIIYFKNIVKLNALLKRKNKLYTNNVVRGKLIKRDVIYKFGLTFDISIKYCEDSIFMASFLKNINSIEYVNKYLYIYCQNPFNSTNSFSPNSYLDYNHSLSVLSESIDRNDYYLLCMIFFLSYVLPKTIYNKELNRSRKQKKIMAIELLENKNLHYSDLFNINKGKINIFRKAQLTLIKKHHFLTALFLNKSYEFFKFCLGRFS